MFALPVVCLILTLLLVLAIYSQQNYNKREITLLNQINTSTGRTEACLLKINNSSRGQAESLTQEIERLSRENLQLEQENGDLKGQIKVFGPFWKE
jgi:cell division protein FtsB